MARARSRKEQQKVDSLGFLPVFTNCEGFLSVCTMPMNGQEVVS